MNKYIEKVATLHLGKVEYLTSLNSNRFLCKIAEDTLKSRVAEGGIGAYAASKSMDKILGYHNLYHGTSIDNAEKINREGFNPSAGGGGAAKHSGKSAYKDNSAGKIHFTKNKAYARFFAGYTEHGDKNPSFSHLDHTEAGNSNMFNPIDPKGKIIKTRVSDKAYQDFKVDPDMGDNKSTASTINKRVSPASIVGHKDNRGLKQFLSRRHLGEYYSSTSGKLRGLGGAALAVGGAGLIAHSILRGGEDK